MSKDTTNETWRKFPLELFDTPTYAEIYICPICHMVPAPDLAAGHAYCGAMFCTDCIAAWLEQKATCPKCREPLAISLNKDTNKVAYNIHRRMVIRCPLAGKCTWQGEISSIAAHRRFCPGVVDKCRYATVGCEFQGTGPELAWHEARTRDLHLALCMEAVKKLTAASEARDDFNKRKTYLDLDYKWVPYTEQEKRYRQFMEQLIAERRREAELEEQDPNEEHFGSEGIVSLDSDEYEEEVKRGNIVVQPPSRKGSVAPIPPPIPAQRKLSGFGTVRTHPEPSPVAVGNSAEIGTGSGATNKICVSEEEKKADSEDNKDTEEEKKGPTTAERLDAVKMWPRIGFDRIDLFSKKEKKIKYKHHRLFKSKQSRKSQDQSLPKKALNPYMCYNKERQASIRREFPGLTTRQLVSRIAAEWRVMTEAQREPYAKLAGKELQRYETEKRQCTGKSGVKRKWRGKREVDGTALQTSSDKIEEAGTGKTLAHDLRL